MMAVSGAAADDHSAPAIQVPLQQMINIMGSDAHCQYKLFKYKPDGKIPCLARGYDSFLDNQRRALMDDDDFIRRMDPEITGIFFQKADTGRVQPVLSNDVFSKLHWANAPMESGRRRVGPRVYIDLDDPGLRVPGPLRSEWVDFADTMRNTKEALITEMTQVFLNQPRPTTLFQTFKQDKTKTPQSISLPTAIQLVLANGGHMTNNSDFQEWIRTCICMGCLGTPNFDFYSVLKVLFPELTALSGPSTLRMRIPPTRPIRDPTIIMGVSHCLSYGYVIEQVDENDDEAIEERSTRGRIRQRVLLTKDRKDRSRSPVYEYGSKGEYLIENIVNVTNPGPEFPSMLEVLNNPNNYLLRPTIYSEYFETNKPGLTLIRKKLNSNSKLEVYVHVVCEISSIWINAIEVSGSLKTQVDKTTEKCVLSCLAALAHNQECILGIVVVSDGIKLIKVQRSQNNNSFVYDITETPLVLWNNVDHMYVLFGMIKNAINLDAV